MGWEWMVICKGCVGVWKSMKEYEGVYGSIRKLVVSVWCVMGVGICGECVGVCWGGMGVY